MNRDELKANLVPFADIGSGDVKVTEQGDKITARLNRDGKPLKLVVDQETGRVQVTLGTADTRGFSDFPSVLASEIFANLRRWADAQREILRMDANLTKSLLPINGTTHDNFPIESIGQVEGILGSRAREAGAVEILLIDGPAGIGKTSLIERLALVRAEGYKGSGRPLILHVKSRGRVLSNLQDLMAFSLQTIRSHVTYDQLPILVKYGLVMVAIDGFDELADPNGYEMAWAQLAELINFVRGKGTLILAGRDTFIGRSRLLKAVPALKDGFDVVTGLNLRSPSTDQAKAWLSQHNWTETQFAIPSISVLLEEGSFALRPVFLQILATHVKPKELKDKHERYLTPLLVSQMIHREAGLFGRPVNAVLDEPQRESFLHRFLLEVAREMADSQTESLDASEISWISETALEVGVPDEVLSLIRNRASAIAFFVNDERPGYRAFMHSYLQNYFLALVAIDALSKGDIPKFIRRNILGSEFLSIFVDVAAESSASNGHVFSDFFSRASSLSLSYTSSDRGLRNAGALVLSALASLPESSSLVIREYGVDEAVVRGVCGSAHLIGVDVSQFDCRGADLSSLVWEQSSIGTLIADESLRVSESFPIPSKIVLSSGDELLGSGDVLAWLNSHGRDSSVAIVDGAASAALKRKPIYALLGRAVRLRQYWIRSEDADYQARRIVEDAFWPALAEILQRHDYLRVEVRQASGRSSNFYHIKHREVILSERLGDNRLVELFNDLAAV